MKLTDKHKNYETVCIQMFVGQTIRAIIYGELKYYPDEEGNNVNPEPFYKTQHSDIDTLDHSIYFKTDEQTIYVFWDNTFISYGLQSQQIDFTEKTNDYEQKWDVSDEAKWLDFVGQKIVDFRIIWNETWTSNMDGSNKVYTTYPQTFEINTENGKTIILSASEFIRDKEIEFYPMMDNLLVTTNVEFAKQIKLIE